MSSTCSPRKGPQLGTTMLPITYIEWTDCFSPCSGPWVDVADPLNATVEPLTIVTVGYVFKETPEYVSICSSADLSALQSGDFEGESVSGIMHIPQTQVRKRVEFDVAGKVAKAPSFAYKREIAKG